MYLVSVYFDEKTDKKIRWLMKRTSEQCGNKYMVDGDVPPHITISAFESSHEEIVIEKMETVIKKLHCGELQWVSVGQFLPGVIFLSLVLNKYLHELSVEIYDGIKSIPDTAVSRFYQPFQWMPHTTIAKKLSGKEMQKAFQVLQNQFGMFCGEAVKIGLAKTNPYRDIALWNLQEKLCQFPEKIK